MQHRILVIAVQDFANVNAEVLRVLGDDHKCLLVVSEKHPFQYDNSDSNTPVLHIHEPWRASEETAPIDEEAVKRVSDFDPTLLIWAEETCRPDNAYSWYGDYGRWWRRRLDLAAWRRKRGRRALIFHAGEGYRLCPSVYNGADLRTAGQYDPEEPWGRFFFDAQLLQADLWTLGARDGVCHEPLLLLSKPIRPLEYRYGRPPSLYGGAVNGGWPAPPMSPLTDQSRPCPLIVVHTPSKAAAKGTVVIRRIMQTIMQESFGLKRPVLYWELGGWGRDGVGPIPHDDMRRIRGLAHLYIDQFSPDIGGFGVSAVEAMQLGLPTFASVQNIPPDAWSRWGVTETVPLINLSGDPEHAERVLRHWCLDVEPGRMRDVGLQSAQFVERYFAPCRWSAPLREQIGHLFLH